MSRRRTLAPEERALWQAVASSAKPLPGKPAAAAPHNPVANLPESLVPPAPAPDPAGPLPAFRLGERLPAARLRHDLLPPLSDRLAQAPLHMDAKTFRNMTRGKLMPEARIDLHGMTLAEAQPELVRFVLNAQAQGARLVLVITGKGKPRDDDGPIPRRTGALRHQVPQWLRQPPLGGAVQQVAEAHLRHGGTGALYVYLRRLRG
jgi:DNA-nicking Smr family endonuclease